MKITFTYDDGTIKEIKASEALIFFGDRTSIEVFGACSGTFIYALHSNDILEQVAKNYARNEQ